MKFEQFKAVFSNLLDQGNIAEWNYLTQFGRGLSDEAKQEQIEYIEGYIAATRSEISLGNNSYLRGYINFLQGRHAEQITCYKEASELNNAPAMVALATIYKNPKTCKLYGVIGNRKDLKQQAIDLCEKAMAVGCIDAMIVLADIYGHEEDSLQESIQLYQQASRTSAYANVAYGNLLIKTGDYEQAEKSYKKALKLDKNCSFALYSLGNLYQSKWQLREAKDAYSQAAELDNSKAMLKLAILLDHEGNDPEELYRRSAKLGNPYAMDSLAIFLQGQGQGQGKGKEQYDRNEIIQLYNKARELGYKKSSQHLQTFYLTEVAVSEGLGRETANSSIVIPPEQSNEPESVQLQTTTIINRYMQIVEQLRAIQFKKIKIATPVSENIQSQENVLSQDNNQQSEDSPVAKGLKELIDSLDNLRIKDTKVVEALEALYAYFKVLKAFQDGNTDVMYFTITDAHNTFKEKISHLVGHPNELFNTIGIALVTLGGAILAALATTAGLGLIIPTTAIGASAAGAGIAATMVAVGLYGIFSSNGSAYDKGQTLLNDMATVNRQILISDRTELNTHLIEELENPAQTPVL